MKASITFIKGRKDWGKTDFGFRLLEDALEAGLIKRVASNCQMLEGYESPVEFIEYFDTLEDWLKVPGVKGYLLDELGIALYKMGFMSKQAKMILKVCQLSRKYRCHLIGMAPTEKLINSLFMNTDILDCFIEKFGKTEALATNIITGRTTKLWDIPRTSIPFDSMYDSDFKMHDPTRGKRILRTLPDEDRALLLYGKLHNYRAVAKEMGISHTQVMKLIQKKLYLAGLAPV